MLPISAAIVFVMLISCAHAGEQNATVQTDTAPIENPPLPRPKPPMLDAIGDNPAVLISAFRHQHGEDSVLINAALTRVAQEQANAMAMHDSLDHNAFAPFSTRMGRSGFTRAAENIAYGHKDFASTLEQWANSAGHRANLLCCTARSGSALRMHKIATEFTGQWSSGRNRVKCGPIRRTARPVRDYANGSGQWARVARCVIALTDARRAITSGENAVTKKQSSLRRSLLAATAVAFGLPLIAAQATPAAAADETAIHPFHYRASESALADLRKLHRASRWCSGRLVRHSPGAAIRADAAAWRLDGGC